MYIDKKNVKDGEKYSIVCVTAKEICFVEQILEMLKRKFIARERMKLTKSG